MQAPLTDRLTFVSDGEDIAPSIRILATRGHTPGHSSLIDTDPTGAGVVVLGDAR